MNYKAIDKVEKVIGNANVIWKCKKWDGLGSILRNGFLETKDMNTRAIQKAEDIIRNLTIEDLVIIDSRVNLKFEELVNWKLRENSKGGEKH